jgi:hypothetical protein
VSEYSKVNARKKALQIVVIVFAVSMGLTGISSIPALIKLIWKKSAAVAVVNDLPINQQEYRYKSIIEQRKLAMCRQQFGGALPPELLRYLDVSENPQEKALEDLITDKVVLSVAEKLKLALAPAYVAKKLSDPSVLYKFFGEGVPQALFNPATRQLDYNRLRQFLQRQGMTVCQFEESVEDAIKEYLAIALTQGAAVVSTAAMQERLLERYAPKTFVMTKLPLAQFIKAEEAKTMADEDIAAYYDKEVQQGRYQSPEKRGGNVWVFKQKGYELSGPEVVTEKEQAEGSFGERFARDVQGLLNVPEMTIAAFARQRNGTKKALLPQQLREDEKNPVVKELFALSKGRRGFLVEGDTGYLVELTTIEKGLPLPLPEVKSKIVADMKKELAQEALVAAMEDYDKTKKLSGTTSTATISWKPGSDQVFEAWRKEGVAIERIRRMFKAGQELIGMAPDYAYIVRVEAVGELGAISAQQRDVISQELASESALLITKEFIASSREHATIVMNTALLGDQA